jgi:mannose-6-phosphate isomerase-like protein (cupin superfamily)
MPTSALDAAVIYVNGRYPLTDFTANTKVESIVHIVKGSGTFSVKDGVTVTLKKGDQLHILKNEAYYFEGALELLYVSTPKWTPEQTMQVSSLRPSKDSY